MKRAGRFLTSAMRGKITKELLLLAKLTCVSLIFSAICAMVAFYIFTDPRLRKAPGETIKGASHNISLDVPIVPAISSSEKKVLSPTPTVPTATPQPPLQKVQATQIGDKKWTVDVQEDKATGTTQEIFQALNSFREKKGKAQLSWDQGLTSFAQSRADLFARQGATDTHAGFNSLLDNGGFNTLGFNALGENSSFGYHVSGTKLIEQVYASDAPHNDNQLADKWTHVGIGVNGLATDLVFGGNKQ